MTSPNKQPQGARFNLAMQRWVNKSPIRRYMSLAKGRMKSYFLGKYCK